MFKLFCMVVGWEGAPFFVNIAADDTVDDLKKLIKVESDYDLCGRELELCLAKTGDAWLDSDGAKAVAFDDDGKVPGFDVTNPTLSMENADCIGANFTPKDGEIHVLVVVPDESRPKKKQRTTACRWKDEEPIVYSLEKGRMYFVNREDAVQQLQRIFQYQFERSLGGPGPEWVFPLVDNVLGLGKSDFGCHFIQKSRETWPNANERSPFQNTLCDCHTISIAFRKGALLQGDFDSVMLRYLMNALEPKFQTPPEVLSNPKTKAADTFLENVTKVCGPVFIVLDNIGAAFSADDLNELEQRTTFLSFCSNVVGKWLWLPKVFFVLVGRGSFLTYVGRRPEDLKLSSRMHRFERLKLDRLREDAIEDILENTWISTALSLWDYHGLNKSTVKIVAKHLFDQTNGHPRSLFQALVQSKSLEDLLCYEGACPLQGLNLVKFYDDSVRHKAQVLLLLEAAETQDRVNMLQLIPDRGERAVSLDVIANKSCIDWEGRADEARVYIHPMVKSYLEGWLMPLPEYIEYIGKSLKASVDYPNAFEWMFIKRFQQAFSVKNQQPRLVMPEFFDSPIFGSCDDLAFSTFTQPMPKITSNGSRFPNLYWIALLGDICLKPLPQSASSNAFLVTKAKFRGKDVKVVCGLAVKSCATTPFTANDLSKECDVFHRMFNGIDSAGYLRIFFVCCTSYDKDLSSKFKGQSYFVHQCKKSFPNIDEVILLNLETPKQRAAFFGVEEDLAPLVEVVVRKAQVE